MKLSVLLGILFLTTIQLFGQSNKLDQFCNQWVQFGYKSHNDTVIRIIKEDCANKKCEFNKNGKYVEDMFCLKGVGIWAFNEDSTKFDYQFTEYMGQKIEPKLPIKYFNQLIIKLTPDTLIYGSEAYYGNDKIYGHDDWYFVRKRNK
jgi:hypothetical protein